MEWYQVLTIIFSVFGLFLWLNSKIEKVEEKMDKRTTEIIKEIREMNRENHQWNMNFHGRLTSVEGKLGDK